MSTAAVDVLGFLPGPASKTNTGAADLLGGEALAYAVASSIAVVDVHRMQLACVLYGAHRSAAVTAVSWSPDCHTRVTTEAAPLRLASGDNEGRVVLWDVTTATALGGSEDLVQAASGAGKKSELGRAGAVRDLAWVLSGPCVLAVLMASGLFLLWDPQDGSVLFKKELGAEALLASIRVNPRDARHLCLCGQKGTLVEMRLAAASRDKAEQQTYKVDMSSSKPNDVLRCCFSTCCDLLYVLLPREVVVFDLEFGQPAASSSLPNVKTQSNFKDILGCYGHASCGRTLAEGGLDILLCSHQDSTVSTWVRQAPAPPTMLDPALSEGFTSDPSMELDPLLDAGLVKRWSHQKVGTPTRSATSRGTDPFREGSRAAAGALTGGAASTSSAVAEGKAAAQEKAGLLSIAGRPQASLQAAKPTLLGLLHTLPHSVTTFSACPMPIAAALGAEAEAVAVIAAVTSLGNVELVSLQRGALMPLQGTICVSLGAHRDAVRGVRWLGTSPRIISFSSEKTSHGFRNSLVLTDIRNRASIPFRELGAETSPMLGIRASASGRYLLVLLRGAPSEIWQVAGQARPSRIRILDLPFTAVEWVLPGDAPPIDAKLTSPFGSFERSPLARDRSLTGYMDEEDPKTSDGQSDLPEERLAFALGDGRVGVLAVKGRKVSDTKPKRPMWGALSGGDLIGTGIAAWGNLVVLGDAEGNIHRWDTSTGKVTTISTHQGQVRRIHFAPPATDALDYTATNVGSGTSARVSVLFATGTFGVWELDARSELQPGPLTVSASGRLGKVIDMSWVPLPHPVGAGSVLAVAVEDGSLAFIEASQAAESSTKRQRLASFKHLIGGGFPYPQGVLAAPPALGSVLQLPRPWALLLRILLQQGELAYLAGGLSLESMRRNTVDIPAVYPEVMPGYQSVSQQPSQPAGDAAPLPALMNEDPAVVYASKQSLGDRLGRFAAPMFTKKKATADATGNPGAQATALPAIATGKSPVLEQRPEYKASFASVLRALVHMRAGGSLLYEPEWDAYRAALKSGSTAARMAVAAAVAGDPQEARFWQKLPGTFAKLRSLSNPSQQELQEGLVRALQSGSPAAGYKVDVIPSSLWDEDAQLAEAREKSGWHEKMARREAETNEKLQEKRMLEYVAMGDHATAVAFLLAATPERSARYYRDALCTLALAASTTALQQVQHSAGAQPATTEAMTDAAAQARSLHIQAAKVVTAHAASVGDNLLGVPLLAAAGLPAEAASLLQEAGLWRYAASLAAHALKGSEKSNTLERWANHTLQAEGGLWRAVGIMTAAGTLRGCVLLLRKLRLPDAAMAFAQAASEAGFSNPAAASDAGHLENLFHHSGSTPLRWQSFSEKSGPRPPEKAAEAGSLIHEYNEYCAGLLKHL
ncbi:hypothetical protein WJX84_011255 [Apatococcus fuscideae]|uniref:Uncharacterized protein n=1 Tax=Apatococcus fuscideae TaxID=2026836 RepID=A0AAW1T1M6_9CHLO